MFTYAECIELRNKLVSGEIGIDLAKEIYWKDFEDGKKSWHTIDWKVRREKFIKDKCQLCDSKDKLTIQHLSHPRKHHEYLTEVERKYTKAYIDINSEIDITEFRIYIFKYFDYSPTTLCPSCKCSNPKRRVRKIPQYRCTECKLEFDQPVYKSIDDLISIFMENEDAIEVRPKCFISKKWKNLNSLSSVRYWFQRELAVTMSRANIEKEAFLLYLNAGIKYLSFEDTITACNSCASNFDLYKMELCPQCKEHYKGIQYPTCIQCLPEDMRKTVLERIEFAKKMNELHKDLEID